MEQNNLVGKDQMYLTLPSNSSMKYFPNNTLATFTTRLHVPLPLAHHQWEVGLSEIHFPVNWSSIDNADDDSTIVILQNGKRIKGPFRFSPGRYATVKAVLDTLNHHFGEVAKFTWQPGPSRVHVVIQPPRNYEIQLGQRLATMLGLPRRMVDFTNFIPNSELTSVYYGQKVEKVNLLPKFLFVYCDMVEHGIVGDTAAPLLRIISSPDGNKEHITKTFDHVHYKPVRAGEIHTIEINIRDDMGDPIPFSGGRVVVILHLRRRKPS